MRRLSFCIALLAHGLTARAGDAAAWTARVASDYGMTPAITYRTASGVDLQLDVYAPRSVKAPNSVVVYFHGGGWEGGTRDRAVLRILPYVEMGFTVVNATYRGSRIAPAPAAVEDCRCVLSWVVQNAAKHHFDVARIVLTGDSAGSHLALITGMGPAGCPSTTAAPKVAAIVNWYGATDVADLIDGPNAQPFARKWIGDGEGRLELAKRLSPLTYAAPASPPVLTVHGKSDAIVPFAQAVKLHEALTRHGAPNRLIAIPDRGHGDFTGEQLESSYAAIRAFLRTLRILPSVSAP